jgi:15-cis-phytoene synthase
MGADPSNPAPLGAAKPEPRDPAIPDAAAADLRTPDLRSSDVRAADVRAADEQTAAAKFQTPPSARVLAAYKVCEDIARREARNFYYAFRALPRPKRNAICAVYAFMRHADDLSDDETRPHDERRIALDAWLAEWHIADQNFNANQNAESPSASAHPASTAHTASKPANSALDNFTTNSVFLALADARRRFNIPTALLDELVEGTAMDLHRAQHPGTSVVDAQQFDVYPTFEDLYRYCYLVASVVGLVCIRIFGYEDPRAEKLAEETGIAFQLTNILRDVREDAERGRIYLPVEDMERLGVTPNELAHIAPGHHPTLNQRELLAFEAARAEHYYQSAQALLPLIAADSRPALWVLVTIYHRLLERITQRNYNVFTEKVRVPTTEKLAILARGLMRVFAYRLGAR